MDISDDFIGVFPNAVPPEICGKIIDRFEAAHKTGFTMLRNAPRQEKDDLQFFSFEAPIDQTVDTETFAAAMKILQECYVQYSNKFSVALADASAQHHAYQMKLQKTEPSQGYHIWHYEQSNRQMGSRLLVWTMYLNTIEEGGETEFLYQKRRVKPEQGTICIFPAAFTHTHRGNPPLSGSKYIATGWYEF